VIQVATVVVAMTGLSWEHVLWELPVAIAYQIQILYWMRHGHPHYVDRSKKIRRQLEKELSDA
jgi:hypothetical protein